MSIINPHTKEINCKIVFYGPALAGKTTSLKALQKLVKSSKKTVQKEITTENRTLFFDFLALSSLETVGGYRVKFQIYTVPGQVLYEDSRKLLLSGVDGIIFVADSRLEHIEESLSSYEELKLNLRKLDYNPEDIPTVIQYNKRDASTAANLDELNKILNKDKWPHVESTASQGEGVIDAFERLAHEVVLSLKQAA
jgi:signal recognition particle receptor subunit beta